MLENMPKRYGIFTTDDGFADEIIDKYVFSHNITLHKKYKSRFENAAIMNDGTEYRQINPMDNNKGYKVDFGVIDIGTCSLEFIGEYIPVACKLSNKNCCVFVDSEKPVDGESYDLSTLIDRLEKIRVVKGNIKNIGFIDLEYGWQPIAYLDVDSNLTFGSIF